MKRELLSSTSVALVAMITLAACSTNSSGSSDGSAPSTGPSNSAPVGTPPSRPIGSTPGDGGPTFTNASLRFFDDCGALLTYMQTEATKRVTAYGLGGGMYPMARGGVMMDKTTSNVAGSAVGAPEQAATAPDQAPAPTAPGFSGTNTQEVGVDEGDITETDGKYVYVAGQDGLRIVSVADAKVVAEPKLPSGTHQMLLDGNRLVVITSSWTGASDTIVSLFDVSDPTNPSLTYRTHLEGSALATRSVDDVARLVISTSFDERLPFVQPSQFGLDEKRALEKNKQIIAESKVEDWLPRSFDEAGDGTFGPMKSVLDCSKVAAPNDFAGLGLTWIASVDTLADGAPTGSAGVVSIGNTVYSSAKNLYIATQNWDYQYGTPVPVDAAPATPTPVDSVPATDPATEPTTESVPATEPTTEPTTTLATEPNGIVKPMPTTPPGVSLPVPVAPPAPPTLIHQFELGAGTDATYVASGSVPGRLLNQFAMSEYNGDLRVATTTDAVNFGEQSGSAVYVLRPNGDKLEVLSSVTGLGTTEQIQGVRFLGDTAYVVTFRQTDPLYVVDLKDPANPVLAGELKIPGYSAYLHPVGDGLLLGVGQDATDDGRILGTKLSLFDVSDPANPQLIDSLPIGGQSQAEWDHQAFLYWPEDGTIVLPISPGWNTCAPDQKCLAGGVPNASGGAIVVQLQDRKLTARGTISHENPANAGCWNPLQRSMAIGSELVTVGYDQMKFSDRQSLAPRATVSWGDAQQYGCAYAG